MSVSSLTECSQEDGVTDIMDGPDGIVTFETVPSDFKAAWTDKAFCIMYAVHYEEWGGG